MLLKNSNTNTYFITALEITEQLVKRYKINALIGIVLNYVKNIVMIAKRVSKT